MVIRQRPQRLVQDSGAAPSGRTADKRHFPGSPKAGGAQGEWKATTTGFSSRRLPQSTRSMSDQDTLIMRVTRILLRMRVGIVPGARI